MSAKTRGSTRPGRNLLLSLCPDVSAGAMPCGRRPDAKQRKKESEGGGKVGKREQEEA